MPKIILFNKPYGVLSQFSDSKGRKTLAHHLNDSEARNAYPAGRLDRDSEGLLILTDNGQLQHRISHPKHKLIKTYWVQVEGTATPDDLNMLRTGVQLNDGLTRAAKVAAIAHPALWPRSPPIRSRKNQPTSWLQIAIGEGRNRQVRRMCANVGLPVLRLVRTAIGHWQLGQLLPGQYRSESIHLPKA